MKSWMKTVWKFLLIFTVIAFTALENAEARRGGGGGSRSRGSSRSSTSRSSSGARARTAAKIRSYSGPRYQSSYWKTGMAVGMVYGLTSYQHRRRYISHPDNEPKICFNVENLHNHTYGYFICPEPNQDDGYEYCCGDEGEQTCCKFFDDGGRVAGVVIGVLAFAIILGVVVYCLCKRCRRRSPGLVLDDNVPDKMNQDFAESVPLQDGYGAPPQPSNDIPLPDTSAWGVQPGAPGAPNGPGQGYETAEAGLPYSSHPADYSAPPPSAMPPAPYPDPTGPAPFPNQPISYQTDDAGEKPPMPQGDISTGQPYSSDPYAAGPGVGSAYNTPNAPPAGAQGNAPVGGQLYPAAPPPPYPGS